MSCKMTEDVVGNLLIATIEGSRDFETVVALAKQVKNSCIEHGTSKVLVDVRDLQGRLLTFESLFLVITHFKVLRDLRVLNKVVVLDKELCSKRHHFLEKLAVNRGYNFRIVDRFDKAIEWLMQVDCFCER